MQMTGALLWWSELKYEEVITLIQSKRRFGQASGREVTRELTKCLGYPEHGMKILHIAGTNGKGSTAAFVSSILQAADFVVGQFTSPHLICFRERIMVNGEMISEADVVRIGEKLLSLPLELEGTMFDYCLGMALVYFQERQCDYVILETGLGGAKDSTAGIDTVPLVCGFSNIGYDHEEILGNTLQKIAGEKAGILKKGTVAVLGVMEAEAKNVIASRSKALGIPIQNVDNLLTKISTCEIALNGVFQRENAALAVGMVESLFNQDSGYLLDKYESVFRKHQEESCINDCDGQCGQCKKTNPIADFLGWKKWIIRQGLAGATWHGRMEIIQQNPIVMVDGAHNPQGVEALFNSLKILYPEESFVFLMGVMAEKDYAAMVKKMIPVARIFLTVTVDSSRSLLGEELAEVLREKGARAKAVKTVRQALETAMTIATAEKKKVIAFGSLYFVGEIKHIYETGGFEKEV